MINFNGNYSNPLANVKVSVRGGLNSTNSTLNSVNLNANSALNSTNSTQNSSISNAQISSNNSKNSSLVTDKSKAVSEILGYGVDSEGYFTSDFNEAAGIPEDYKIHSSTAQSIVNVSLSEGGVMGTSTSTGAGFLNVDIAQTFGNAYKILSQVVGEGVLNSKDSFITDEIAGFAQGYYYDKDLSVKKVYGTIYDYFDAVARFDNTKGTDEMSTLFYNASSNKAVLKPATDILSNSNGGKEDKHLLNIDTAKSKHTNADGSITKGGLLVAVINQNKALIEGETNINGKLSGFDRSVNGNELSLWIHSLPLHMAMDDNPEIQALNEDLMNTSDINEIKSKILNIKRRSTQLFDEQQAKEKGLENYKSPLMQMLDEMLAQMKERAQKALQKQREKGVDIKA